MIWKLAIAALVGYITRHLVGIVFKRMFKKRMPDLFDGAQFIVEKTGVKEILVSFDGGRAWFIRTISGWSKVNQDFVRKTLDRNATDNPGNYKPPTHPTVS
jgi:hypothetical protein